MGKAVLKEAQCPQPQGWTHASTHRGSTRRKGQLGGAQHCQGWNQRLGEGPGEDLGLEELRAPTRLGMRGWSRWHVRATSARAQQSAHCWARRSLPHQRAAHRSREKFQRRWRAQHPRDSSRGHKSGKRTQEQSSACGRDNRPLFTLGRAVGSFSWQRTPQRTVCPLLLQVIHPPATYWPQHSVGGLCTHPLTTDSCENRKVPVPKLI